MTPRAAPRRASDIELLNRIEQLAQDMWQLLQLERDITRIHLNPLSCTASKLQELEVEYRRLSKHIFGHVRDDRC